MWRIRSCIEGAWDKLMSESKRCTIKHETHEAFEAEYRPIDRTIRSYILQKHKELLLLKIENHEHRKLTNARK